MSESNDDVEVSVVMPCLNESQTLEICIFKALKCFKDNGLKGEVVIADNGSTDGSQDIATKAGARVVHQDVRGYGAALHKGFDEAQGEFIVMADADDSYDFLQVHEFIAKLREGYDLVMGTRLKGEIKPGAMPWLHRYVGNPILTFILNALYRSGISDAHCGLRGFRKDAVDKMDLRSPGMEFASEMVIKAVRSGLKITEIPTTLSPDKRDRPPHLRSFPDGWRHLRLMLMLAPDVLFIWPGIIMGILGLSVLSIIQFSGPIEMGGAKLAENTMIFSMMTSIIGFQLLYLGLFSYLFINFQKFDGKDEVAKKVLKFSKFEKGVVFGGLLFLAGLLGDFLVFQNWYAIAWGDLDRLSIRSFIFASTLMVLGFQIIISSFLLNMIGVDRAIYSGDLRYFKKRK